MDHQEEGPGLWVLRRDPHKRTLAHRAVGASKVGRGCHTEDLKGNGTGRPDPEDPRITDELRKME